MMNVQKPLILIIDDEECLTGRVPSGAGKVRIYRTNRRGGSLVYTMEAIQKAAYSHLPNPFSTDQVYKNRLEKTVDFR